MRSSLCTSPPVLPSFPSGVEGEWHRCSPPLTTSSSFSPFLPLLLHALASKLNSEALSETPSFPSQQLANLVASKVYYHLGSTDEALRFALGAGKLFAVELTGEEKASEAQYVETVICESPFL
jgi:hypothetical protein